jgi:endo-1,4-beta-xylanase
VTTRGVTRRGFIWSAAAAAGSCALPVLDSSTSLRLRQNEAPQNSGSTNVPLKDRAARRGLLCGSAVTQTHLSHDSAFQAAVAAQCNIMVPEVELKWERLRPTPDTYNFSSADWLSNYAQHHHMKFRGHALVWHEELPSWFASYVNPQNAKPLLLDHIATVVGRYAGKIHSWDVVNEVIWPPDKRSDGLRDSPWLRNIGADHIEIAFRAAAKADPLALLTWNENWLEEESSLGDAKRTFLLQHLKELLSRGVPIQAIGLESHLIGDHKNIAGPHFKEFLSQISDMGLKILVTEMDIRDFNLPNDIATRDQAIADLYYRYLTTVLEHKTVVAVLTWGMSNKYSWTATFNPRADHAPVRPLPYDADMNPSPAWNAIAQALDNAPPR